MLERQREGIAKAKAENKYLGRKPLSADTVGNVIRLDEAGLDRDSIAEQLGIGVASVEGGHPALMKRVPSVAVHRQRGIDHLLA
jgi:DNA invertase Pin-like site-specific DNA recombinase